MLSHSTLAGHLKSNFALKSVPGIEWSIGEIEELTPFEKDAYLFLTNEWLKKRLEGANKR
ncbi:baseplate hub assembly catalyst [Rhizobium phage RHph_N34]|uniref:Baseplate hub assembly catalyst protein n=2 Tax=Trinifflemingvirus TaxID=3044848 RepID=A0A7S5RIK4_9CAUD|nr:baseplate hub assembly catalyst [Rhizobium phage RHph_N34]YP_010661720.1 baseplate hub assembly catalyst [Rhizobium phage RHph_I1_9]QIG69652.1 baseplate hub assembly catalyst protein [Rhizobium phage RHph_I46]QIG70933.1 baseplate hub assembly catalyst protein [Rhizobium phage RHph_I9]QIG76272.1 baseplate hub assembly catalyst protein [Rhizobium phage RHph_I34]QIG73519.1 baseplate hub assembly catalyst protein [Rhizobium phage RHph_I1_9]QIG73860.1 baseplate hub assembly catalyst protein [Rh